MQSAVILLTGTNLTFKREKLEKLLAGIPKDEITVYFGGEVADEKKLSVVFAQCRETGLFGGHNVVVLKEIDELTGRKKTKDEGSFPWHLDRYLAEYNPDTVLIMTAEKADFESPILARIEEIGEIQNFPAPYESDIVQYVRRKLAEKGIQGDADLPEFIQQLAGKDIEQAEMMLSLVENFTAQTKTITVAEARTILSSSHNLTAYDLVDGVFHRDAAKALHAVADLRLEGESLIAANSALLRTAKGLWSYLAKKDTDRKGRNYFMWQYSQKCDLRFVSSVLDCVRRVEIAAKTAVDDLAWIELERFLAQVGTSPSRNSR
jgi:DNA polymerase III delta subunit